MKRLILFSTITPNNKEDILNKIFPIEIENKIFSYMPSGGVSGSEKYIEEARSFAEYFGAEFKVIDNSVENNVEGSKDLLSSNILVISGGNTFQLLINLRTSGLDVAIKEFIKKNQFVLAGFSAGALVLTPNINVCNLPEFDENLVGITDLTGLGIVDFEVFPHYNDVIHKEQLEAYRLTTTNEVKEIDNDGCLVIDL